MDGLKGCIEWVDRMGALNGWIKWTDGMDGLNRCAEWMDRPDALKGWIEWMG